LNTLVKPTALIAVFLSTGLAAGSLRLDVPFVRQEKDACGAACLTMVMRYWRALGRTELPEADPTRIQRELYVPAERGIPGSAMRAYLEQAGFHAFTISGQWSDLQDHIAKGRPLIVCLSAPGRRFHYVVVTGLDEQAGTVLLHDPARRQWLSVARSGFERNWRASGHWTLVAAPATPR
jgi:predicted double-glycine peptidase